MYNEYLNIKEVCDILKVTQSSMSRWIREGKFPSEIEGIRYKIKKIDVLYYLIEGEFSDGQSISHILLPDRYKGKALKSFTKTDYKNMYDKYYTTFGAMTYKLGIRRGPYDDNLFRLIFFLLDIKVHYFEYHGETHRYITNRDFESLSDHYSMCNNKNI